jgi:hypothetical protein
MHTRRMATFLLGAWIGCSILMALMQPDNLRTPARILLAPSDQAAQIMKKLNTEESRLLLHYMAAEQNRRYLYIWEECEIGLAVALGICLFLGTQKRIFPLVCCGLMLLLVLFKHFAIGPEMLYRGREADFPPGNATFGTQARLWALDEVYVFVQGAIFLLGGILASYMFIFRTRRVRKSVDSDVPDHSPAGI